MGELPTIRCPLVPSPDDGGVINWNEIPSHCLQSATGDYSAEMAESLRTIFWSWLQFKIDIFALNNFRPSSVSICRTEFDLRVRFCCSDQDIWGTYVNRDDPLYEEEVVEVFLCPTGDLRHYYESEVSPRNVIFDAKVYSPDLHRGTMQVDIGWDCPGLETKVTVDGTLDDRTDTDRMWTVEMAIPFAAFPEVSPPKPGDVWRANFCRIDRADPPEFSAWSPTGETPANFHVPEKFGYLEFE